MKTTLLAVLTMAIACAPQTWAQSPKWAPENDQQLRAFLIGTKWAPDADPEGAYVFLADGHFKGALQPTYAILGRRLIMMHWAPQTNIRCLIDEGCTTMTELGGERHVFVRLR